MINPAPDQSSMYCGDMLLSDIEAPYENHNCRSTYNSAYSGKMPVKWTMPTKISMRIPAATAYVLMPKTMPMTIDSTRNIIPALDILPT